MLIEFYIIGFLMLCCVGLFIFFVREMWKESRQFGNSIFREYKDDEK